MRGVIDYWANIFTPDYLTSFFGQDELRTVNDWWHMGDRTIGRSVEEYVADMDAAGVAKVVIPALQMKSFKQKKMLSEVSIEQVLRLKEKAPERIEVLYGINGDKDVKTGVRELRRAIETNGCVGAHLHTYGFGLAIDDRRYYPYYEACDELGVPVVMQVGHSAEHMPNELGRPLLVDHLALDFPELRIVCSHTGWPWVQELVALAWKHPNVFIGTAAYHPRYWDRDLVDFLNTRGRGKVMYGSDFPVMTYTDSLATINQMEFRKDAKERLLYLAAEQVFGF